MTNLSSDSRVKYKAGLQVKSKFWRIVIPNLIQYQNSTLLQLTNLKYSVLQRLLAKETKRGLQHYRIAIQHHQNGVPHLDILLTYTTSKQRRLTDWDYLLRHGYVTAYRNLNKAIIQYGTKEDKASLSNFPEDTSAILDIQQLTKDPFAYLYARMKEDPLHFNLQDYVYRNELSTHIKGWSAIKTKLKDMQLAAANHTLRSRPGIAPITRARVQERLTPAQLQVFDSWQGYSTIVDHLNQMSKYGFNRPLKTSNLLVTGRPNIGKTSLFHNPNHLPQQVCVQDYTAMYQMGMVNWFPKYQSDTYSLILWNQAKLTSYSYDVILKLLEGSHCDLPAKGSSHRKVDNPLVIMTSNMTLEQLICQKFPHNPDFQSLARQNLSVRIKNVIIPPGYDLFLLQKLLVSC
jgi:hypothetical protein